MLMLALFSMTWIFMIIATLTNPTGLKPYLPDPTKQERDQAYEEKQEREDARD